MRPVPAFADFYRAINDRDPFPWQDRLARQVEAQEAWPREVGVPTGLGKTACLEVAIWWLASQAHRPPADRTAPTRIWWVVNRRLLVDSTAEHATRLADELLSAERSPEKTSREQVLATVASRLRSLAADPDADPLQVIRLRGGVSSDIPIDPSQPCVLLSTVPMYGSRLLFRGYGSTRSRRPMDAALAGTDSLVLLDEAHLAFHLRKLMPALRECAPEQTGVLRLPRDRPRLVSLTATGEATKSDRFDLDAEDEAHPVVRQRVHAAKPMTVRQANGKAHTNLVEAALSLLPPDESPASCLVFANTPATARAVFDLLQRKAHRFADILLLTGRAREREAEAIRKRILHPVSGMPSDRIASESRKRHLIVVATQTLEVGADLDAEYMVTEACGVRALTQRLGRLNRLGRHSRARAIYIHTAPRKARRGAPEFGWPVYGKEPQTVLERLESAPTLEDGSLDMSPGNITTILGEPLDTPGRAPELLPGLLWEWIKTTNRPSGEAAVEPYFSGIARPRRSVRLIWRAHIPTDEQETLWPRPRDSEVVEVLIGEAREALGNDEMMVVDPDDMSVSPQRLRPGHLFVLPSNRGLMDAFGWNPAATEPVVDVSLEEHGLPLSTRALDRIYSGAAPPEAISCVGSLLRTDDQGEPEVSDPRERTETTGRLLEALRATAPPGWLPDRWAAFLHSLKPEVVSPRREAPRLHARSGRVEPRSDAADEASMAPQAVDLDAHGHAVGERARAVAERLGLDGAITGVLDRAGRLHDIGKSEIRFQRWLNPDGEENGLVAKSTTPRHRWEATRAASGWPRGGRHEDLSARLARRWLDTQPEPTDPVFKDLLIHLIISHHGHGRPLVRPVRDGSDASVEAVIEGRTVEASTNLEIVDWGQPGRFRRLNDRFGPWGLALLETIIRRADHSVSGARAEHGEIQ